MPCRPDPHRAVLSQAHAIPARAGPLAIYNPMILICGPLVLGHNREKYMRPVGLAERVGGSISKLGPLDAKCTLTWLSRNELRVRFLAARLA